VGLASIDRRRAARDMFLSLVFCSTAALTVLLGASAGTQDAIANGDTRSLTFFHTHTRETATITYRRNGQYDEQALAQLNWLLRDWRVNAPAKMDPRLFDVLWEVYRETGSRAPIHVVSAYRSPVTNAMLRRRSSGVSEHSQHMLGKAMDIRLPDVETGRLRAVAMRLQYGGVGYYPSSEFVHVDTGNVRAWPRMTQEQLARLFPDGKTLHLPSNGKPLPRYEEAKAEILPRNAALATQAAAGGGSVTNVLAALFGRKNAPPQPQADRPVEPAVQVASASPESLGSTLAFAPLPPRRPKEEFLPSVVEEQAPEPGAPIVTASVSDRPGSSEAILGYDQKAAARALFDPRPAIAHANFSPWLKDDLTVTYFSGPAVKPLPVIRQAGLGL